MPRTPLLRSAPTGRRRPPHEVEEHLLALAAHDGVDPWRLLEHLRIHEGAMDAAQHRDHLRIHFLGDLEQPSAL
jgi:hypothetical protein